MSRYKKASLNEVELSEIGGVVPVLRPSRDEKLSVVKLFLEQQKNKDLDIDKAKEVITELLYNSLFLWENHKRTDKKEEGADDITREDIEDYVVDNLLELWLEILNGMEIIDKKKLQELQEKQLQELEKEASESDPN